MSLHRSAGGPTSPSPVTSSVTPFESDSSHQYGAPLRAATTPNDVLMQGRACKHMGAGAAAFTARALAFHHTADGIGDAANRHAMRAVLAKLDETLSACTSCHATYEEHVVDDATWTSLTNEQAPASSGVVVRRRRQASVEAETRPQARGVRPGRPPGRGAPAVPAADSWGADSAPRAPLFPHAESC